MEKYIKGQLIGAGAFGQVYEIVSEGEQLCIKEVDYVKAGIERSEAEQEAKNWKLLDHPNIVKLKESFFEGQLFCTVMEKFEGRTLDELLQEHENSGQQFEESFILNIFSQLVDAVRYCEEKLLIHRDLKPANILISKDNKIIKIIDFGLSRALSSHNSLASTCCGTPLYMSPELLNDEKYSFSTDVWSLGVILYEFLTLSYPFETKPPAKLFPSILSGIVPPITRECSSQLKNLVLLMIQRDPINRISVNKIQELISIPTYSDEEMTPQEIWELGKKYESGDGVTKDLPKAQELWKKA